MMGMLKHMLLTLVLFTLLAAPVYGAVSSTALIEDAKRYTGVRVEYQGEAIGDLMERGGYGWVNLHDGNNAIGIWAPVSMLRQIKFVGDYNFTGDTVVVVGVYDQACDEHGGDIDIHAETLKVVRVGGKISHPINTNKAVAALILVSIAVALFFIERYRRRHLIGGS